MEGKTHGSLQERFPELLKEWDWEKNRPLKPFEILPGSHKRVWWKCAAGHSWQAVVKSRTSGSGCPFCANRKVSVGENDLGTTYPELAEQWSETRNGDLRPCDVVAGSHKRVWWRCAKGHEWQAEVCYRALSGTGCPVCSGKVVKAGENDLASAYPQLAAEWCAGRNGDLRPDAVTPSSNRRVWWRCEKGHEWNAVIAARVRMHTGCPYCAGRKVLKGFNDLATRYPNLAAQWEEGLNGALKPDGLTAGSSKRVWWRCEEGHVWKAAVYSRTGDKKCGCPVCAGMAKNVVEFKI